MVFAELLKLKSDSPDAFENFVISAKALGHCIKTVRIDNDFVFLGHEFMDICKKHSIHVERTAPYAHHQLGRMERQWRTLGEAAQTLLNEAHLGRAFWGHAFLTVVHTRNRVWNSGSNCIPYCAVTNKKPDLSKLRVFGCPCYVHIDSDNRNKFNDKS